MRPKLNLELREKVVIHSTTDSNLDGKTGINLGTSCTPCPISDYYMILLDEPLDTHLAINMTESCLARP